MSELKELKVGQGVSIFDGNTWCYCIADTDEFIASLKNGELILGDVWELGLHKSLIPEGYAIVPIEPKEDQWDGLTRQLVLWMGFSHPTPNALFSHLSRVMHAEKWEWIKNEPEMQSMDSVVSKGSRACLIYKSMVKK